MKVYPSLLRLGRLATLALVVLIAGCIDGEDSTAPDQDDLVVGGLVIRENGVTIASVLGSEVFGNMESQEGSQSLLWSVVFVDDKGVQFTPFANENMEVTVANEAIATFTQEGTFTGRLQGVAAGETTAIFRFLQDAVVIYTSLAVPVVVIGPD